MAYNSALIRKTSIEKTERLGSREKGGGWGWRYIEKTQGGWWEKKNQKKTY